MTSIEKCQKAKKYLEKAWSLISGVCSKEHTEYKRGPIWRDLESCWKSCAKEVRRLERAIDALSILTEVTVPCSECIGRGYVDDGGEPPIEIYCPKCKGTAQVPVETALSELTDRQKSILSFIQSQNRPVTASEIADHIGLEVSETKEFLNKLRFLKFIKNPKEDYQSWVLTDLWYTTG